MKLKYVPFLLLFVWPMCAAMPGPSPSPEPVSTRESIYELKSYQLDLYQNIKTRVWYAYNVNMVVLSWANNHIRTCSNIVPVELIDMMQKYIKPTGPTSFLIEQRIVLETYHFTKECDYIYFLNNKPANLVQQAILREDLEVLKHALTLGEDHLFSGSLTGERKILKYLEMAIEKRFYDGVQILLEYIQVKQQSSSTGPEVDQPKSSTTLAIGVAAVVAGLAGSL